MNGGNLCLSQNHVNHTDLIDSQLSFSNFILSRYNSDNYSSDSLLIALNRNNLDYNQFCKYIAPKTDPIFFKNITYSYSRISYLFDEKREVIYWMDKYNIYLRGLKNRFGNKNKDWLASSKRTNQVSDEKELKETNTEHVKEERFWKEIKEKQRIADSIANVAQLAEFEAQRLAEEAAAKLLAEEEENQRISDSLAEIAQIAEFEAQQLAEESAARLLAEEQKSQRVADSIAQVEQLAEYEAQRLAEESAARLLAEEQESQRIADSIAQAEQLAEYEAQLLVEESAAKLLVEEQESQRIADSIAEAEQLAEFEGQRLAEEAAAKLLAEKEKQRISDSIANAAQLAELEQQRKEEEARLLAEQMKNKRISDSLAELRQLAELEQQRKEEEARLLAEQTKNKRISDSLAELRQLAELEQQRKEEEARLLAEQMKNKRISDSLAELRQLAELEQQRKEEEARLLAEQTKNKRISDSLAELRQLAELEQQRKVEEARLLADQQKMTEQDNQILAKSQRTNDAAFSDMYTAPKTEFSEYYTIKLTTVYSPMEGISFLNNVRDGDEIWKENAFHLYQDEYNSDLTNISIGKFSSLDEADIVINKLKNKGLTNAKAIKYSNKMKLNTAANSVKKKSGSNPVVKTTVVKPVEKTVVNNSLKISDNSTNENLAIKTSLKPSSSTKNSSVNNENKPTERKDVKTENVFSNISKEVNQDQDFFTVQLAAVSEITSDRINTISLDKKQLFYQNINAGNYALNYKKYSNYGEAHAEAIELHGKGFEGAYVTKYVNNKRITVTKSDLVNDNVSESAIEADLRSLGYKPLDFSRKGKYIQIGSFYNWDSHSYQDSYEFINHSIYYMVDQSHIVKFLIGPFTDRDLFIELRNVKKQINDAFIKNI